MIEVLNVVIGLFAVLFLGFCAWGMTAFIRPTKEDKERPEYTPFNPLIAIFMMLFMGFLAISIFDKIFL